MKLLQRIQGLDASRRFDVVNKYIPAVLVERKNNALSENENVNDLCCDNVNNNNNIVNNIVIGHIHSDLVDSMRKKLEEEEWSNNIAFGHSDTFLLPPLLDVDAKDKAPSPAERFFGLRVDENKIPKQEESTSATTSTRTVGTRTEARNAVFERFTNLLLECKIISKKHTDMYPITDLRKTKAGGAGEILATVNRNAAPFLGITSVGVHLLCYVRDDGGSSNNSNNNNDNNNVFLWLAQRAANKSHHALRWDPTVAGGQPASMGLFDNVVKEAGEEAGIDPGVVAQNAVSTGCLSQMTCKENGTCMKQSLYYTWDMRVDRHGFVPHPADGEVARFRLFSARELEHEVRHGNLLRPAMILVVTDFLIRQGVITPDNEPDYANILAAMHRERLVLDYGTMDTNDTLMNE